MNNLDDIKALWHTAPTDSLPSSGEMLKLIRKFRSQKLRNKWLVIIFSFLSAALVGAVLLIVPFKLTTTYIGAALMILGSLLMAATNIKSLKRFYHLEDHDNLKFLEFIAKTRENQIRYHKRTKVYITSIASGGLLLYIYELAYLYPKWILLIYFIMTVYLGIMWFIVHPRAFKRDQAKLNATRERVENILNQIK